MCVQRLIFKDKKYLKVGRGGGAIYLGTIRADSVIEAPTYIDEAKKSKYWEMVEISCLYRYFFYFVYAGIQNLRLRINS